MEFYTPLSEYYDVLFPPSREQKAWALNLAGKGPVLDAGCGTGELLLSLACAGIPGYGFDADEEMIRKAMEKSVPAAASVDFRNAVLTEAAGLYPNSTFTALLCMGNTLAHVRDLNELDSVISDFSSLLKNGGRLAIQLLNYDRILIQRPNELPPLTAEQGDTQLRFLRRYRYIESENGEQIQFSGTLQVESREKSLETNFKTILLPLRRKDLEKALSGNGFKQIRFWEDYETRPATEESAVYLATALK